MLKAGVSHPSTAETAPFVHFSSVWAERFAAITAVCPTPVPGCRNTLHISSGGQGGKSSLGQCQPQEQRLHEQGSGAPLAALPTSRRPAPSSNYDALYRGGRRSYHSSAVIWGGSNRFHPKQFPVHHVNTQTLVPATGRAGADLHAQQCGESQSKGSSQSLWFYARSFYKAICPLKVTPLHRCLSSHSPVRTSSS